MVREDQMEIFPNKRTALGFGDTLLFPFQTPSRMFCNLTFGTTEKKSFYLTLKILARWKALLVSEFKQRFIHLRMFRYLENRPHVWPFQIEALLTLTK